MSEKKDVYSERWYVVDDGMNPDICKTGEEDSIAVVYFDYDDGKRFDALKRANLMSAAPELLEAMEATLSAIREYLNWDGKSIDPDVLHFLGEYRAAEHAIKKAKGANND